MNLWLTVRDLASGRIADVVLDRRDDDAEEAMTRVREALEAEGARDVRNDDVLVLTARSDVAAGEFQDYRGDPAHPSVESRASTLTDEWSRFARLEGEVAEQVTGSDDADAADIACALWNDVPGAQSEGWSLDAALDSGELEAYGGLAECVARVADNGGPQDADDARSATVRALGHARTYGAFEYGSFLVERGWDDDLYD